MTPHNWLAAAATGAAAAALLASCTAAPPPTPSTALRNVETIEVTAADGGGYQVTTVCYGATRLFLRVNSIAAVGNDPTCAIGSIR